MSRHIVFISIHTDCNKYNNVPFTGIYHVLNGIFTTFYNIAIPSFLPEIVTDKDNLKANAQLALSESLSIVIGPMLAGIVITLVGLTGSFTVDAVTYFVCFMFVLFISKFKPHTEGSLKDVNIKSIYENIYEGLIYFKTPCIRANCDMWCCLRFLNTY